MPDEANIMSDAPAIEVADLLAIASQRDHHPADYSLPLFRLATRALQETVESKRHTFSLIAHY